MTRPRLAAVAALSMSVLLVAASGGEAARDRQRASSKCREIHKGMDKDYAKVTTEGEEFENDRARAAAYVPLVGAKVIVKLEDLSLTNGNNVVDAKDTDRTNDNGVAKNKVQFNAFGNYRLTIKTKADGEVVDKDTIDFGVDDRENGRCGPPIPGAG